MNEWHGFQMESFNFEGRDALIVFPKVKNGRTSWALKTEYWDAFPDVEIKLLEHGFHLAFIKNRTRFATPDDYDLKARFVRFISEKYGLDSKCVPVGMSLGGAHAMNFAGHYPELVSCMYIDAPVLSFLSYPGKIGDADCESIWIREFSKAYPGVKRSELLNFEHHPINAAKTLIEHRIPILMVYGNADEIVIYTENAKLLEDAYEGCDLLTVIVVEGRGHHPHGIPDDNTPIVDFILQNS